MPSSRRQAENGDVGERLRPERDVAPVGGREQRPCPRPQRALAVDDERRAELLREVGRGDIAEGQIGADDPRRVGEHLEHVPRVVRPGHRTFYAAVVAAA